jgi:hypothetical protein
LALRLQRWQVVTHACALARIAAFFKFSARRGAPFVNATGGAFTHFTSERCTSNGHMVSATHAAGAAVDLDGQASRNMPAHVVEFVHRKINTEIGATSAASRAG